MNTTLLRQWGCEWSTNERCSETLPGVGEEEPTYIGITAWSVIVDRLDQANRLATKGHQDAAQAGIAADPGGEMPGMHGVVAPVLHTDQFQTGVVTHDHREVACVLRSTGEPAAPRSPSLRHPRR